MLIGRRGLIGGAAALAPSLGMDGSYSPRNAGRKIRVYRSVDTRMMFGDFFSKMRLNFGR